MLRKRLVVDHTACKKTLKTNYVAVIRLGGLSFLWYINFKHKGCHRSNFFTFQHSLMNAIGTFNSSIHLNSSCANHWRRIVCSAIQEHNHMIWTFASYQTFLKKQQELTGQTGLNFKPSSSSKLETRSLTGQNSIPILHLLPSANMMSCRSSKFSKAWNSDAQYITTKTVRIHGIKLYISRHFER